MSHLFSAIHTSLFTYLAPRYNFKAGFLGNLRRFSHGQFIAL